MRNATWLAVGLLTIVGGCKKDPALLPQSPICQSYLACIAAAEPEIFATNLPVYGPEGDCWKTEATAATCATACQSGLAGLAKNHPLKTECKGAAPDGGTDGPPRVDAVPRPDRVVLKQDYGPLPVAAEIDLLFVIDNSNSMGQEQKNLISRFGQMLEALRSPKLGNKIPNLRIGIVSTDLGAGSYSLPSCEMAGGDWGKLQKQPRVAGCSPPTDPWISYSDGVTNIPAGSSDPVERVKEAFACIADLGTGGCGFEHQLEAARLALDPAKNVNPGFLRPSAYLAIVFVTDEDDCSAKKPQLYDPAQQGLNDPLGPLSSFRCFEFGVQCDKNGRQPGVRTGCVPGFDWLESIDGYAGFFAGLKPPGRTFVMAIAGPTEPVEVGVEGANPVLKSSCQGVNGIGVPAIRIAALTSAFGSKRGFFNKGVGSGGSLVEVNICSTDFGAAMRLLGERLAAVGP